MPISGGGRSRAGGSLLARLQSNTGKQGPVSALLSFAAAMRKAGGHLQPSRRKQQIIPTHSVVPPSRSGHYLNVEERAMSQSERLAGLSNVSRSRQQKLRCKGFQIAPNSQSHFKSPWDDLADYEMSPTYDASSIGLEPGFCQSPVHSSCSTGILRQKSRSRNSRASRSDRPMSSLETWRREAMHSGRRCRDHEKEGQVLRESMLSVDSRDMELQEEPRGPACQLALSCRKAHRPRRQAFIRQRGSTEGGNHPGSLLSLQKFASNQTPGESQEQNYSDEESALRGWWYRNLSAFDIVQLAEQYNLPIDQITRGRELFSRYDTDGDGELDCEEFQLLLRSMLREQYPRAREVPRYLFSRCDVTQNGKVDFCEFLEWFSMNSFREGMLLSPEQQRMRSIARKWGIPITEVEKMKMEFDKFDNDRSGTIDLEEFRKLLNILLKVPPSVQLPENRVNSFWKEIDADSSGEVDFEEFLSWYRKYFDTQGDSSTSTIEQFYASIRGVSHQRALEGADDREFVDW
eukprot:gnl/MRDRNA2_/MRDRNA2_35692_c0_seq1.p1 gnl/MRDRNA2_/MRDRNA2_35692_c0~~gnl/MRDRNA2_/MRDRNA2_35692_c0_seq1.p1  ORF type:complete len:518 (+),score=93.49 gnl/MRDRNA2_/MRDRNA2_35692_c0_seq1:90-1643(+)